MCFGIEGAPKNVLVPPPEMMSPEMMEAMGYPVNRPALSPMLMPPPLDVKQEPKPPPNPNRLTAKPLLDVRPEKVEPNRNRLTYRSILDVHGSGKGYD